MLKIRETMTLHQLGMIHGTDKATYHKYLHYYDSLFSPWRHRPINFLEIGIWKGFSIRMWHDYFPKATIYCVDKYKAHVQSVKHLRRVKSYHIDATDKQGWDQLDNVKFDIVIDDGSHMPKDQKSTFDYLRDRMKTKSYYIVEDLQPKWAFQNGRHPFADYMTGLFYEGLLSKRKKNDFELTFTNRLMVMKNGLG